MSVTHRAFLGLLAAVALAPTASFAQAFDLTPGDRSLALRRGDQLVEVAYQSPLKPQLLTSCSEQGRD